MKIERRKKESEYFNNLYYFLYFDKDGQCLFERKTGYTTKENCRKGIGAVFNAINQDADG